MQKKYKGIIKGLIVLCLVCFLCTDVSAEKKCDEKTAKDTYQAKAENDDNGKITASIKSGQFTVTYTMYDVDGNAFGTSQITLNANEANGPIVKSYTFSYDNTREQEIHVVFVYTDENDSLCKASEKEIKYDYTFTIPGITEQIDVANSQYDGICKNLREGVWTSELDGYVNKTDFLKYNPAVTGAVGEYQRYISYCYTPIVKTNYNKKTVARMIGNAVKSYKSEHVSSNYTPPTTPTGVDDSFNLSDGSSDKSRFDNGISLVCDAINIGQKTKEYQYINKNKYFAYDESYSSKKLSYSGKTITCQKSCSEELLVEYGPPVATKAGLCFEYKVKVTSTVTCDAALQGTPPSRSDYTTCEPTPYCNNLGSYFQNQAGPNDEFDSCILSCDNGKYSQACINKCYDKVYGSGNSNTLSYSVKKAANCGIRDTARYYNSGDNVALSQDIVSKSGEGYGEYYRLNGKIYWREGDCYWDKYSRWYLLTPERANRTLRDDKTYGPGDYRYGSYIHYNPVAGFKRAAEYKCSDNCYFKGCGENDYLNAGEADKAYETDANEYDDFASKCSAEASCSTKTAEFTIKVNNKTTDNPTVDNWITYDSATITNRNLNDASNIVLDRSGCYGEGNISRSYMTEWSFPGTWINNKTGEIKYEPVNDKTWHKKTEKFCTNLKSADVNQNWWYYGYTRIKDKTDEELVKDLEYNIKATAKDFGHYSWNIDVSCFYALNDNKCDDCSCDCTDPTCEDTKCNGPKNPGTSTSKTLSYRVRTVDNKDLFPSTEETATGDKTETGRTPGFNWTGEATNLKNKDYIIAPEALIAEIQEKGDTVYSDDKELDYEFYLDREALNAIRKYSSSNSGNYTSFNGNFEIINGVSVYKSSLFRGTGSTLDSRYVKRKGVLGCNNQRGDKCYNYSQLIGG